MNKDGIYKRESYVNGEGKQVAILSNIEDETEIIFAVVLPMMTPVGLQEMDFITKKATSVPEAFEEFDEIKNTVESEIKKQQNTPKLAVPGQNKSNLKLVTP